MLREDYSHDFKATTKERSELRDCVGNAEIMREDRALWQIASENEPLEMKKSPIQSMLVRLRMMH
ncbi:MAG: hypothetical protein AAF357_03130 [Verrucomicrobiota bacterium]